MPDNEQSFFPGLNCPRQKHQEHAVRFGTGGSFHLSTKKNERLSEKLVSCQKCGLASGKVCQRPSISEVEPGFVQTTKRWWSDWSQTSVNCLIQVSIPSAVDAMPSRKCAGTSLSTLLLRHRQEARGVIRCSQRPHLAIECHK
jgi:hypothetical protein